MAFAKVLQLAEVKPSDKILLVGAGMGYGAAIAARLAGKVVALEQAPLVSALRNNVAALGNVAVAEGKLADGARTLGPYDAIIVEGRVGEVPEALLVQLTSGGRLVAVAGEREVAKAEVITTSGKAVSRKIAFDASIAPLPGFERKKPAFVF
jgi:protein-L-isoaspartate(D-aspartate) O-methyltransferase